MHKNKRQISHRSGSSTHTHTNTHSTNNNNRNIRSSKHYHHHSNHNNQKQKPNIHSSGTNSRAFRDCKWDIVYLTSSPLVFGNDPYKPLIQLNIKQERETFFSTLRSSKLELRVIHQTATTSNIIAAVTGGCTCIHYSGHGYPQYLAFEDSKRIGETHLVHNDLIRQVCEDEAQRIEFVFASACHSEAVGQAFIEAGIQHVVAVNTKFEVTDEAASTFTEHFYNCILHGKTIAGAFKTAKNAVKAIRGMARADYHKFLLLPRKGDHNKQLFINLKPGELIDGTAATPVNNLPPAVSHFVGRAIDMRHIIHQLMDSGVRLLVLNGDPGIGKSATALMVARYFCDRRKFEGGIFFIDVKKLNSKYNTLSSMLLKVFEECGVIDDYNRKKNRSFHRTWPNQSSVHSTPSNKEDVFNIIRSMGEMLLVFDGLDQFGQLGLGSNNFKLSSNYHPQKSNFNIGGSNDDDIDEHMNINDIENIEKNIQSCLQNIFERTNIETKVLVTSGKKLHMFADFTNCIARYYTLRKLKPKDAAELFSLLCNQFRHTDIVSNTNLMRILEYNPLIITQIVQIKHQYQCTTLEGIVKAYHTKRKIHDKYNQQLQQQQQQKQQMSNKQNTNVQSQQINNKSSENKNILVLNEENIANVIGTGGMGSLGTNIIDPRYERQMLAEKCIQSSPIARDIWIKACGMQFVHYSSILPYFQTQFAQFTGSKRPLKREHLLGVCTSKGKMGANLMIQIQYFDALYMWFDELCHLVQLMGDVWNELEPCVMAGFVSRAEAHAVLSVCPIGTFLIRFSMTSNKSIAISYRDDIRLALVQNLSSANSSNAPYSMNNTVNNGSIHVSHLKGTLITDINTVGMNDGAQFAFTIKSASQYSQMVMSLGAFIQIYSKISHLFDYQSQSIIDKKTVYFGDSSSVNKQKLNMIQNYGISYVHPQNVNSNGYLIQQQLQQQQMQQQQQVQQMQQQQQVQQQHMYGHAMGNPQQPLTYFSSNNNMISSGSINGGGSNHSNNNNNTMNINMNMNSSRVRLRSHTSNHSSHSHHSSSINQQQLPLHFQPSGVTSNGMVNSMNSMCVTNGNGMVKSMNGMCVTNTNGMVNSMNSMCVSSTNGYMNGGGLNAPQSHHQMIHSLGSIGIQGGNGQLYQTQQSTGMQPQSRISMNTTSVLPIYGRKHDYT